MEILLLICVVPTVIIGIGVYWVFRSGKNLYAWALPDDERLINAFVEMREKEPDKETHHLINRVLHQQAIRSGLIGAITSVGGVFTLPIALPIDLVTTARIQSTTLHFIAWAYEMEKSGQVPKVLNLNEILGMKGGGFLNVKVDEMTQQLVIAQSERFSRMATRRALLMVGEKAFAKLIPGIGFLIGFGVNYVTARSMGHLASEWYSGNIDRYGQQIKSARENIGTIKPSQALKEAGNTLNQQMGAIWAKVRRG
jgi:hypothetical protein